MTWRTLPTHSRIELVKEHWCSGYSASDIARSISARLGEKISRNVICGMYVRHRDKLTNHPLNIPNQPARARNPAPRPPRVAKPRAPKQIAQARSVTPKPPKPVRMPIAPPQARFILLVELGPLDCRWVVNGPPHGEIHRFCGCKTKPGSSWCDFHADLVFERSGRSAA